MIQWRTFNFTYGKIDVRAKLAGDWPAIWLLGYSCQAMNINSAAGEVAPCIWPNPGSEEIDIAEVNGGNTSYVYRDFYSTNYSGRQCGVSIADTTQWHVYTLIWSAGSLTWQIDGANSCTITDSSVPSTPMFLIMEIARSASWQGGSLPATTQIDYVRVTPAADNYTLTLLKSGTGAGAVTSSPSGNTCGSTCSSSYGTYASGTIVTLSETPDSDSSFLGWSGACSGTGLCSVTMSSAETVTATFNLLTSSIYTLVVKKSGTGSGTVTSSPSGISCGLTCSKAYNSGTVVTLTASPNRGTVFTGWSGAGCSGTGSCTVTMDSNETATANFRRSRYRN
jgi:beta-glucanase (GH16 family)